MASSRTTIGSPSVSEEAHQAQAIKTEDNDDVVAADASKNSNSGTADASRVSNPLKARKRTKTGCLTCRKRRIKCGEERPTCSNCVKSKRNCEGYTPRVIFKDPLSAFRPGPGAPQGTSVQFHPLSGRDPAAAQYGQMQLHHSANQVPLPVIAPRPSAQDDHVESSSMAAMTGHPISGDLCSQYGYPYNSQMYLHHDPPPRAHQTLLALDISQGTTQDSYVTDRNTTSYTRTNAHPSFPAQGPGESENGIEMSHSGLTSDWSHSSPSSNAQLVGYANRERYGMSPARSVMSETSRTDRFSQMAYASQPQESNPDLWRKPAQSGHPSVIPQPNRPINTGVEWLKQKGNDQTPQTASDPYMFPLLQPFSTVDDREDDYWDVDSDEENVATHGRLAAASTSDLGLMLALSANQNSRGIRSLHGFLNEPNVLATYHPVYTASPLMDPQTARVFCHFITATAPTLSLGERHPANPSIMFSGHPVPPSQRSLWTYTMPMLALTNQGLLHAMLALASLHIAKLQQTSPTPSLKHYHYALRRVAKALSKPTKRQEVATLAATLLLGFYEVTTAEHNKWNSHLAGARQLIMDIDFVGLGKRAKAHKVQLERERRTRLSHQGNNGYKYTYDELPPSNDLALDQDYIDENLVSALTGWRTSYKQYGSVHEIGALADSDCQPLTAKEMENFDVQCDLFWWYRKQDMYQSMVSGNRLLLPYERWSHCPPRAPVGKLDAVFGTMDHLILLVARIADFNGKDQKRKIRASEVSPNQRNAQPGGFPEPPSQSNQEVSPPNLAGYPQPSNMQQQPPSMYGMLPPTGPVRLPSGFTQEQPEIRHRNSSPAEEQALEAATIEAEREWNDLCNALDVFEESLGPDYQPLSPDHMQPLSTPFGPALYYRAYSISCVWALFYTARLMAARGHPSMPPAAMAAVGAAAPVTASWANTIGRICAGIQPLTNTTPLNPTHGAALTDSCMGLFHAGVQYRDAAQRGWTITKLRDVARLTGWQTSALIASGCERSWMRAAEMGKGPAYQRTMNMAAKDDRVAGRSRDPVAAMYPPKDNNDRRFITVNPGTRVYWAMGILSVEEDMKVLRLQD